MIDRAFIALTRFPTTRTLLWKLWYNYLGGRYRQDDWTFMNYGYAPLEGPGKSTDLPREEESDRYCIQLYDHLASRVPLRGKRVIEVGSGRGGGCAWVHRRYSPKATRGLDFSASAVRLCQRRHRHKGLSFREGDAGNLPLPDGCVDAVLNVESSHCYPDRGRFFQEVARVLRPGGHFLYTDFFDGDEFDLMQSQMAASGLEQVESTEITPNVLRALDLDHARKRRKIERLVGRVLAGPFSQFAGLKGSKVHQAFADGTFRYWSFVMRKPAA